MRLHQLVSEARHYIFGSEGVGSTGYNRNIDYEGYRVYMTPHTFLSLATKVNYYDSVDHAKEKIKQGAEVAAPFIIIRVPESWEQGIYTGTPRIISNDGKNRMKAAADLFGLDAEVEVHLIVYGFRNRDFTGEFLSALNKGIYYENSKSIFYGSWFST